MDFRFDLYENIGLEPGEVGTTDFRIEKWIHPKSRACFNGTKRLFRKIDVTYQIEFRIRKKNGEYALDFNRADQFRDDKEDPIRIVRSVSG